MTTQTKQIDLDKQLLAFGQAFKRAYEQAGLSKRAVATAVPLDRSALGKIERGLRAPKFETLLKMAKAAQTTPAALLGGAGADGADGQHAGGRAGTGGRGAGSPGGAAVQATVGQAAKRFGANLRRAREAVEDGMTQEDLAFYAKVDRSSVSGYETGRVSPGVGTILKLAQTLEVAPATLLADIALR